MKSAAVIFGVALLGSPAVAAEANAQRKPSPVAGYEEGRIIVAPGAAKESRRDTPTAAQPVEPSSSDLITTSRSGRDVEFLMAAYENVRVLAWLAEMARDKAQDEQLRTTAATLERKQEEEKQAVRDLAKRKSLKVEANGPPVQQSVILSELPKTAGAKLDSALAGYIRTAMQETVSMYERGLQCEDEEIRKFSGKMLPEAKEKLKLITRAAATGADAN